ncbi:MAG: glucose-1-phosphate thymidylyltransferase, partial [Bacteroidota bacterium]
IQNTHAICEYATVNMGAKLRGDSVIGPWSKVGGEVGNSVFWGYSNKAHDGYVGNSVIGQWCNLGADTNTSNLKNNYGSVRAYNYAAREMEDTGEMFVGLLMGDHSKCGINTMFNTGTVVGVAANIFGAGYPPKHIPSFAWGGAEGFDTFDIDKCHELVATVMGRRKVEYTDADADIIDLVFEATQSQRWWEEQPAGGLD